MTRPVDEGNRQDLQWLVLHALQKRRDARRTGDPPRKVRALVLARACGIRAHGTDDSRKKGLRNVVRAMRQAGIEIASDLRGYWLPVDASDHAAYRDFLRRQGLARLVEKSRAQRSPAAAAAAGQMSMFEVADTSDNLAMCH